jgi:hypothetical protein
VAAPIVQVDGARELRRTLRKAGDDLADLTTAHGRIAAMVGRAALFGVPRRTGRLASTIRPAGTKTQAIVRAGLSSVPYAGPIEWGWPRRHIRPDPYVVPAAHETEPEWTRIYVDAVQAIVDRVRGA